VCRGHHLDERRDEAWRVTFVERDAKRSWAAHQGLEATALREIAGQLVAVALFVGEVQRDIDWEKTYYWPV
jgi:hypothetical protein